MVPISSKGGKKKTTGSYLYKYNHGNIPNKLDKIMLYFWCT